MQLRCNEEQATRLQKLNEARKINIVNIEPINHKIAEFDIDVVWETDECIEMLDKRKAPMESIEGYDDEAFFELLVKVTNEMEARGLNLFQMVIDRYNALKKKQIKDA